jgi:hypothetical protein
MVDAPTVTDAATSGITSVLSFLPAAAGLGTAAMGLVDSSKVFWGGRLTSGLDISRPVCKSFYQIQPAQMSPSVRPRSSRRSDPVG